MIDVFEECKNINGLIEQNHEQEARNELIKLLDKIDFSSKSADEIPYIKLLNHLLRIIGLYPYIKQEQANWEEQFICDVFRSDIGGGRTATLHREQSRVLGFLLRKQDLAISAPTSFGKSFIIDAFIAIAKPRNVVIIVPTIALTDETRRRLYKKFGNEYKIITTSDVPLEARNIFIFPQERAIGYANTIKEIDILIIDEFYKASPKFEKERSSALLKAILKLGGKAKQRYFLAPSITEIKDNIFTKGIHFEPIDFNTVFLEKHELQNEITDEQSKSEKLLSILQNTNGKTLIYAGTYVEIENVSTLLIDKIAHIENPLLTEFSKWIALNYDPNWALPVLVRRGIGIHNGQLHRSLGQIQIKLFEEPQGLQSIVSTSSIIEGVNTSAENVIIWRNRNGQSRLNDFTYKNIIGRGGRMFKHFVGQIYILDAPRPPLQDEHVLTLEIPEGLLVDIDQTEESYSLEPEQVAKILAEKEALGDILGVDNYDDFVKDQPFQSAQSSVIKAIAYDINGNQLSWNGLNYLNSPNPNDWGRLLFRVLDISPIRWDAPYSDIVAFVKIISKNWQKTIPQLLDECANCIDSSAGIGIKDFFKLERAITFKLAAVLSDLNIIQKQMLKNVNFDISPFISKLSYAFLPPVVYQLEEYGMPRMISRKIHDTGIINFENSELSLHQALEQFRKIGINTITDISTLDPFDKYIIRYFYDGITFESRE